MARAPRTTTQGPPGFYHRAFDYKPPRFLKIIRYGLIAAVTLAVAAILYSVYWYVAARNLRDVTQRWFAARQAEGLSAGYDSIVLAGFPAAIRVEIAAPHLARELATAPWQWRSARAAVQVRPWNLRRAKLEIAGKTEIGFIAAGAVHLYAGDAGTTAAELAWFGDGRPRALEIAIDGLHLSAAPQAANAPPDDIVVKQLRLTGEDLAIADDAGYHDASFDLAGTAAGVTMPSFLPSPLGQGIAQMAIRAQVLGPLRIDDGVRDGLTKWRDGGGTVEIAELAVHHGPLDVQANGTLALDDNLQPVGALTARIAGFFETIDAFQHADLIRSRNAAMAKLVLSALAKRPEGGGPPTLSIPVTLQDSKVYAGPVQLATLPRIEWPQSKGTQLKILR